MGPSPPLPHVVPIHREAKQVRWNEPGLGGLDGDDADEGAIGSGDDPALPETAAEKHGRDDGERARNVIESKKHGPDAETLGDLRRTIARS